VERRDARACGRPSTGRRQRCVPVGFSADGTALAAVVGETVRVWHPGTRNAAESPFVPAGGVNAIGLSPDGTTVAVGGDDNAVRLFNAETHALVGQPLTAHAKEVNQAVFSPNGKILATAGYDATVRLWNVETRHAIGAPLNHDNWIRALAFSPDARTLATACDDGRVRLWDVARDNP
jgi:WD40 repeat protein